MRDEELIGWVPIGAGGLDLVTVLLVTRPRLSERSRAVVVRAVAASGVLPVGLGLSFVAHGF